jgi:hypothetical protein
MVSSRTAAFSLAIGHIIDENASVVNAIIKPETLRP